MPYILNKTNGNKLTTLDDATLDNTTDLTFVGRNYAGYGEIVNENFIKLLENFANRAAPARPLVGQLWFNTASNSLSVCYDGTQFKRLANIRIQQISPAQAYQKSELGDLWYDEVHDQVQIYTSAGYKLLGPTDTAVASWQFTTEISRTDLVSYPIITGLVGTNNIVTLSDVDFEPISTSNLYANFSAGVKKGITIAGTNALGSSIVANNYFWGTASEALVAVSANTVAISVINSTPGPMFLTFVGSPTNKSQSLGIDTDLSYDPATNVLNTTASSARYADLAERYESDAVYEVGTVVIIGGDKEVTVTHERASTAVAGIVSKNPAYMMNSDAGTDETHPYIALKGRIPCKIEGPVEKGQLLVSSTIPGHATAWQSTDHPSAVIGKALETFKGFTGIIEVAV